MMPKKTIHPVAAARGCGLWIEVRLSIDTGDQAFQDLVSKLLDQMQDVANSPSSGASAH